MRIVSKTGHCSVLCCGLAILRPTPQCIVSNIKGNHSERCKFLRELYQTSKRFTVHWVTYANLLHWWFLLSMPSMRNNVRLYVISNIHIFFNVQVHIMFQFYLVLFKHIVSIKCSVYVLITSLHMMGRF